MLRQSNTHGWPTPTQANHPTDEVLTDATTGKALEEEPADFGDAAYIALGGKAATTDGTISTTNAVDGLTYFKPGNKPADAPSNAIGVMRETTAGVTAYKYITGTRLSGVGDGVQLGCQPLPSQQPNRGHYPRRNRHAKPTAHARGTNGTSQRKGRPSYSQGR